MQNEKGKTMVDEIEAKEIFVDLVNEQVYEATKEGMREFLLPDSGDDNYADFRSLFSGLDEQKQALFLKAIDEAISMTVFNFLVLLDNQTTGTPLEDTPSDLGLYLQSAGDEDAIYNYQPSHRVRINRSYSSGGNLHDAFMERITGG